MSAASDHRVWVRYTRSPELPGVAETQAGSEQTTWSAQIQDISRGGINLLGNHSFDPGTVLKIEFPNSDQVVPATILARVVHASAKPNGVWALGCAFVKELREKELQVLLKGSD
jgi:PilZ domain